MGKSRFDLKNTTKVSISANGDLKIKGWNEIGALAVNEDEDISIVFDANVAKISSSSDLSINLPEALAVEVIQGKGDIVIKNISGSVEIQKAGGDVKIVEVKNPVDCSHIGGDFICKDISGPISVNSIGGDFMGENLGSSVQVGNVGGDLTLRNCLRDLSAIVGGDASAYFATSEERKVLLQAGGDVQVHFTGDPSGHFNTIAGSGTTEVQLLDERQLKGTSVNQFDLGTNLGSYKLVAGGDIHICNMDACQSRRHKDHMEGSFDRINIELEGVSGFDSGELQKRIDQKLEQINLKTEQINAKIEAKMQKHLRKIQNRMEGINGPSMRDQSESRPASDPVTEEEKKLILKMLQEKKISPDEAERLFESLEKNSK